MPYLPEFLPTGEESGAILNAVLTENVRFSGLDAHLRQTFQTLIDAASADDAALRDLGKALIDGFWADDVLGLPGYVVEDALFYETPSVTKLILQSLTDHATFAEVPASDWVSGIVETIAAHPTLSSLLVGREVLAEALMLAAIDRLAFPRAITDAFTQHDAPTGVPLKGVLVEDGLGARTAVLTAHHAAVVVLEALALAESLDRFFDALLTDGAGLNETPAAGLAARPTVTDTAAMNESPVHVLRLVMAADDGVGLDDATLVRQCLAGVVSDGVSFGGVLDLPDGVYTAWVVNSETGGLSEYDHYPFNSFAAMGASALGASDAGIYELEGSTDAGVRIDAEIRTGLIDFGSSLRKAVPAVYIGYTADGALLLKVQQTHEGRRTESWYELVETQGSVDQARFTPGKGLRARFWSFALRNVAGSGFKVETISLLPVVLQRRF